MTILELQKKYSDDKNNLIAKHIEALKARLKEVNLDGLVVNKRDGRIGWLVITEDGSFCCVEFHHRTKSGEMSKNASGWSLDVEADYEPYKENKNDK